MRRGWQELKELQELKEEIERLQLHLVGVQAVAHAWERVPVEESVKVAEEWVWLYRKLHRRPRCLLMYQHPPAPSRLERMRMCAPQQHLLYPKTDHHGP
jgi:hypothetical protein